jgi:predicted permease
VVAQIAISVLLLVAAGLFVHTLANLHSIELGFNRENLLLFSINARQAGYEKESLAQFYEDLHSRLGAIPGARSVTESNYALVSGSMWRTDVVITGATQGKSPGTAYIFVGPSFLTTMQIPVLLGHDISEHEVTTGAHVAVVNERFVKTYFSTESPLGRNFKLGGGKNSYDLKIIGVAKDVRYNSLKRDIPELAYIPYSQDLEALRGLNFELRVAGDPLTLTNQVRRVLHDADARIPLSNVTTQTRVIEQTIGQERTFATLCTCFAVLALAIACVGLYGTMAYNVARRTNEIGLRMALGAERPRLIWMILREVFVLSTVGLAIGLPIALAASDMVKSFLFGMQPHDPLTISLSAVILILAAVIAGWGPAWRASRIDPMQALRQE